VSHLPYPRKQGNFVFTTNCYLIHSSLKFFMTYDHNPSTTDSRKSNNATPLTNSYLTKVGIPAILVWLWSTGFLGAKYGLSYSDPVTLSAIRFGAAATILTVFALIVRAPWPQTYSEYVSTAITGILLHGVYMVGVFVAIFNGTPAWVASLLTGIHPMLTAIVVGSTLNEQITTQQWFGFAFGLFGVILIIWPNPDGDPIPKVGILSLGIGLVALTGSTVFQKRFGSTTDLRTSQAIQLFAACLFVLPGTYLFETREIEWTPVFIAALGWLTIGLSIGMISLLFMLIRQGEASKIASLFYLIPPLTAIQGYLLFDEIVTIIHIAGMVLAGIGVLLVTKSKKSSP